eukprot:TRINITY_DN1250_c0_g1_i1.p2 TRINITY_DN1250_c0_g1~~TRINITY_DN1250_c0_g1_i1.p2  ORF type:complete len:204 (+),score=54.73 TRINITY_DN1250_c0_g1_i1:1133-1744(+)
MGWIGDTDFQQHYKSLLDCAAEGGDVRMVQWLLQQGHSVTPITFEVAAHNGHLHLVKHLAAQGYAYDINVLFNTTLVGGAIRPAQMEWLRGRGGGDWSQAGMTEALLKRLASDHADATYALAQWLLAQGAQWPESIRELTRRGAPIHHVVWALQHGCGWGGAARTTEHCEEAERCCRGLRRALHELGCPCACEERVAMLASNG